MATHVQLIEDDSGDVVDVRYYCAQWCATTDDAPQPSAWPGGDETDYCVYCYTCGRHMWCGLEEQCNGSDAKESARDFEARMLHGG